MGYRDDLQALFGLTDVSYKADLSKDELFHEAIALVRPEHDQLKVIWCQFWGAHQRFFKYLCIAAKVERAVQVNQV